MVWESRYESRAKKLYLDIYWNGTRELVFPLLRSTKTNTNQYLTQWAKKAGIEKCLGWHAAGRTFGTLALQARGDLKSVSSLLGHKKITHTARYLKTDSATQRATVEAIPSLEIEKEEVVPLKAC